MNSKSHEAIPSKDEKTSCCCSACGDTPPETKRTQEKRTQSGNSGCGCGSDAPVEESAQTESGAEEPPAIHPATSMMTMRNRLDHILARWGFDRGGHRVDPGLYALGRPTPDSLVFVTANYSLSFDALRTALRGLDAYILILNTYGINVWCAAGKGTFGTEEMIRRIGKTRLGDTVRHRRLILPQLGAPGVDAAAVGKATGFRIQFGPVRANDLPEYLRTGIATPAMRRVRFPLWDRLVLIPVELMSLIVPLLILALLRLPDFLTALLAGVIAFPILLPWLPTANYSTKGYILGALAAAPFAANTLGGLLSGISWHTAGAAAAQLLALPPITAFIALNYTGATPFPSPTGVRREIFRYVQPMAVLFGIGMVLWITLLIFRWTGLAGIGA